MPDHDNPGRAIRPRANQHFIMAALYLGLLLTSMAPGLAQQAPAEHTPSETEAWAAEQIRRGSIADFHERCGGWLDPATGDSSAWQHPCRAISERWLLELLKQEVPRQWIILVGARVDGGVDLRNTLIKHDLRLEHMRIDGDLVLAGANLQRLLSLRGTLLAGTLYAQRLRTDSSLIMTGGAVFKGPVLLHGANISQRLDMGGAIFEQKVDADALRVGGDLLMNDGASFMDEVILRGASIGDTLNMQQAVFAAKLDAAAVRVATNLLMDNGARFLWEVNLHSATIGDSLEMGGAIVVGTFVGDRLHTVGDVALQNAKFTHPASLAFARIDANLELGGADFAGLDLTGVEIGKLLSLVAEHQPARWPRGTPQTPALNLRNARAGALREIPAAWPNHIELDGFTYAQFSDSGTHDDSRLRHADVWKAWLDKSVSFSPQPYMQLAKVLSDVGQIHTALSIQFQAREQERYASAAKGNWGVFLWLSILSYLYGYGIGLSAFRVLFWVAALTAAGVAVLWWSVPVARAKGLLWCVGASLDRLLPIVKLNQEFGDFFNDPRRERLKDAQLVFFAVISLCGWLLGSFLLAAIAGLTQKA